MFPGARDPNQLAGQKMIKDFISSSWVPVLSKIKSFDHSANPYRLASPKASKDFILSSWALVLSKIKSFDRSAHNTRNITQHGTALLDACVGPVGKAWAGQRRASGRGGPKTHKTR